MQEQPQLYPPPTHPQPFYSQPAYPVIIQPKTYSFVPTQVEW